MISRRTVEQILDTARIEEVVGDFINLKRRGANMLGLCPFHQEKTPSFNVHPAKNLFKCFGCGKAGDAVAFIREHEGYSFEEALRYLAGKYHIPIEETADKAKDDPEEQLREQLFLIARFARDFYADRLNNSSDGLQVGKSYFRERGFNDNTIKKFELGFAPASGTALSIHAVQAGYKHEVLKLAGLANDAGKDFFRDRVIFPIHNMTGKPIAFAGRIMGSASGPKYINSPETPIYHKSNVLFGLNFARQAIRKEDECLLVEGYTDVMSLVQEGIEHVVASSGTALTPDQIRLIKRFTENLTIIYDGDSAGINAALRGLDLVLEQDMNVRLVMLPEGQDPDTYVVSVGRQGFIDYLHQHREDFILFKMRLLLEEGKQDPTIRAKATREIIQSVAKIVDNLKRSEYIKICAVRLDVDEGLLIREVNQIIAKNIVKSRVSPTDNEEQEIQAQEWNSTVKQTPIDAQESDVQEMDLIRVLLCYGDRLIKIDDVETVVADYIFSVIGNEAIQEIKALKAKAVIARLFEWHSQGHRLSKAFLKDSEEPEIIHLLEQYEQIKEEYSENWVNRHNIPLQNQPLPENNIKKDTLMALHYFQKKYFDRLCQENKSRITDAYEKGDFEKVNHYISFQIDLERMRNDVITKALNGTVIR